MDLLRRSLPAVAGLLVLLFTARAPAEEEVDWQPGEVAEVAGQRITWDELCVAAVEHLAPALRIPESTASSVLERVIREHVVAAECARRELDATSEEIEAGWATLDARTRRATGGAQGLSDVMAEHVVAESAVRARLADEVRGRKLVAAGVSLAGLEESADVRVFLPTARGPAAPGGPAGAVLLVEGRVVDRKTFGLRLLANLGAGRVRSILDAECRARLAEEARLTPEAMRRRARLPGPARAAGGALRPGARLGDGLPPPRPHGTPRANRRGAAREPRTRAACSACCSASGRRLTPARSTRPGSSVGRASTARTSAPATSRSASVPPATRRSGRLPRAPAGKRSSWLASYGPSWKEARASKSSRSASPPTRT